MSIDATLVVRAVQNSRLLQWCKRHRWFVLGGMLVLMFAFNWLAGDYSVDAKRVVSQGAPDEVTQPIATAPSGAPGDLPPLSILDAPSQLPNEDRTEAADIAPQSIPNSRAESPEDSGARLRAIMGQSDVVAAEKNMLKIAERQSKSDYKLMQSLIQIVKTPDRLDRVGWFLIDGMTEWTTDSNGRSINRQVSEETLSAYYQWRAAIIAATPPKYSIEDVKKVTSAKAEFSSPPVLKAKVALLNTADKMGEIDKKLVEGTIRSIEKDGNGWSTGDLLMGANTGVSVETIQAYREWKAAVFSAP